MTQVFYDEHTVLKRLMEVQIPLVPLQEAAKAAYASRSLASVYDAPTYGGFHAWNTGLSVLRELLHSLKAWHPLNIQNFCLAVNDHTKTAIAVVTGDLNTGNPGVSPSLSRTDTKFRQASLQRNTLQGDLFPDLLERRSVPESVQEAMHLMGYKVYFLILNTAGSGPLAELSLPIDGGDDKSAKRAGMKKVGFLERIIIRPDFSDRPAHTEPIDDPNDDFPIVVSLK